MCGHYPNPAIDHMPLPTPDAQANSMLKWCKKCNGLIVEHSGNVNESIDVHGIELCRCGTIYERVNAQATAAPDLVAEIELALEKWYDSQMPAETYGRISANLLQRARDRIVEQTEEIADWKRACENATDLGEQIASHSTAKDRRIGELEKALRKAQDAMRAPLDDWKGHVERAALDLAASVLGERT